MVSQLFTSKTYQFLTCFCMSVFLSEVIFWYYSLSTPPFLPLCTTVQTDSEKGGSSVIWLHAHYLSLPLYHYAPLHRGVFCQFPFRWIYYYGSNKSTGNETDKNAPLCTGLRKVLVTYISRLKIFLVHIKELNEKFTIFTYEKMRNS